MEGESLELTVERGATSRDFSSHDAESGTREREEYLESFLEGGT